MSSELISSMHRLFSCEETHAHIDYHSKYLASLITECFNKQKVIGICGNGGSCADAQHFSSELVCTYRSRKRPPIAAIALTTDTSILTAWSNDVAYDSVFARQIKAHRHILGLFIALSTSGKSSNVNEAIQISSQENIPSVLITGNHNHQLPTNVTHTIKLPSSDTPVIQLLTSYLYHATCEILEETIA